MKEINPKLLTFLLALIFLFLFGCATNGKWVKADSTDRDWSRDYSYCQGLVAEVGDMFTRVDAENHCLIGKGWDYVDEQGNTIWRK
jgi:hypothetical protein